MSLWHHFPCVPFSPIFSPSYAVGVFWSMMGFRGFPALGHFEPPRTFLSLADPSITFFWVYGDFTKGGFFPPFCFRCPPLRLTLRFSLPRLPPSLFWYHPPFWEVSSPTAVNFYSSWTSGRENFFISFPDFRQNPPLPLISFSPTRHTPHWGILFYSLRTNPRTGTSCPSSSRSTLLHSPPPFHKPVFKRVDHPFPDPKGFSGGQGLTISLSFPKFMSLRLMLFPSPFPTGRIIPQQHPPPPRMSFLCFIYVFFWFHCCPSLQNAFFLFFPVTPLHWDTPLQHCVRPNRFDTKPCILRFVFVYKWFFFQPNLRLPFWHTRKPVKTLLERGGSIRLKFRNFLNFRLWAQLFGWPWGRRLVILGPSEAGGAIGQNRITNVGIQGGVEFCTRKGEPRIRL